MKGIGKKWTKSEMKYVRGYNFYPVCENCDAFENGECRIVKGFVDGQKGSCNFFRSRGRHFSSKPENNPTHEKFEARYREHVEMPVCRNCKFYEGKKSCKLVEGLVSPKDARCIAWKKKEEHGGLKGV